MANPLKVLVDLQARRNVAVSGTLEVTGSTTLAGLTAGTTSVGGLTATGVTVNGSISGSGTLQVGGNTLLTSLTASSVISGTSGYFTGLYVNGVAVNGASGVSSISSSTPSLLEFTATTGAVTASITANPTFTTVTASTGFSGGSFNGTTISGSGTLQAGGALTVAGASALNGGVTSTTISASSTIQAGGALTASALSITNAATIGGSLVVTGDLTVNGTTTTINSVTMSVDDKNIILAATANATDTAANGGGITLSGSTDKTFVWIDSTDSWTSSENMDLASGKTYKINGTDVLSSTALGNNVVASSLTSVGILTSLSASGHTAISTLSASAVSGTAGTFTSLAVNGATVATQTAVTTALHTAYRALRCIQTGSLDGVNTVQVNLTTLGGSSFADTQKDYVSVNVMVRSGSTNNWQNDLVAVHLSSSGGNLYALIDSLGNDMDGYRLIAVNENDSAYSISF